MIRTVLLFFLFILANVAGKAQSVYYINAPITIEGHKETIPLKQLIGSGKTGSLWVGKKQKVILHFNKDSSVTGTEIDTQYKPWAIFKCNYFLGKKNLEIEGQYLAFYYPSLDTMSKGIFKNGIEVGKIETFYSHNRRQKIFYRSSGVIEGSYQCWDSFGQIRIIGNYSKMRPKGLWTYYWPNGKLKCKGAYLDSSYTETIGACYGFRAGQECYCPLKTGKWIFYDKSGKLIRKEFYDKTGHLKRKKIYSKQDDCNMKNPFLEDIN